MDASTLNSSTHRTDASALNLSVAEACSAGLAILTMTVLILLWIFKTFETKEAARGKEEVCEKNHELAAKRIEATDTRVGQMDTSMRQVAVDVSYIRGKIEPRPDFKDRD